MKIVAGIAGMTALLAVFAIQRLPGAERIVVEKPTLDERINAIESMPLKKQDRVVRAIDLVRPAVVASTEPVPVKTETIRPDPAPAVPALVALPDDAPGETGTEPKYRKRIERERRVRMASRGDVCSRHGMRKVTERGGKSWRCRR